MKVTVLTNEYPPYVYGGAGIHVYELVKQLVNHAQVVVYFFGKEKTVVPKIFEHQQLMVYPVFSPLTASYSVNVKIMEVLGNNIEMVKNSNIDLFFSYFLPVGNFSHIKILQFKKNN